jgi:hypothetical protein
MKKSFEKMGKKMLNVSKIEFKYATLPEYFDDMMKLNYTVGRYRGDFFVYTQYKPSSYFDHHWGGYFISRPLIKWMIRDSLSRERGLNSMMGMLNLIRVKNPEHIDTNIFWDAFSELVKVREYNPVLLHHDAITGTHGNTVNRDYKRMIAKNHQYMDNVETYLEKCYRNNMDESTLQFTFYNPSLYTRDEIVNVTVGDTNMRFSNYPNKEGEIHETFELRGESFAKSQQHTLYIHVKIPPLQTLSVSLEHGNEVD